MKLYKHSAAILATGCLAFGGAHAAIVLNPSAMNGDGTGNHQLDAVAGGQVGATNVNSIQTTLSSVLNIAAATGASGVGWTEAGAMIFNTYNNGPQLNGNRTFAGGQYDVYGLFTGAGTGGWTGNQFGVTGISSFKIDVWGSPQVGTALTINDPSSSTDASGGVTKGSKDFLLGTAVFAGSFGGTNAQINVGGSATTQLTADFTFTAADPAYKGLGGYFEDLVFQLNLAGSGSSNSFQSKWSNDGTGGINILTWVRDTDGAVNGATGNIRVTQQVPEPGALALAGLSLVALMFATSRKRKI